ncbi:MAG: LysR family transcriptional regulator [Pseudomonadota bacterium]
MSAVSWMDARTAYVVAKRGSVSHAAAALGVHRSTVVRHVDSIEEALAARLFVRHSRGYSVTDLGRRLQETIAGAEDELAAFVTRCRNREDRMQGELHIACMEVCKTLVLPAIAELQSRFPDLCIRWTMTHDVLRLEHGEAHAAIRIGAVVPDASYVHEQIGELRLGLFAHRRYADQFGIPASPADADAHRFLCIAPKQNTTLIHTWLHDLVPARCIRFLSPNPLILDDALDAGLGIGMRPLHLLDDDDELIPVWPDLEIPVTPIWCVAHVDLVRTARMQTLLASLRQGGS